MGPPDIVGLGENFPFPSPCQPAWFKHDITVLNKWKDLPRISGFCNLNYTK